MNFIMQQMNELSALTIMRSMFIAIWGAMLIAAIVSLVKDLLFYNRNGWDYAKDSGERLSLIDEVGGKDWVLPNEKRVKFATPLAILVLTAFIYAVYYIPESWY